MPQPYHFVPGAQIEPGAVRYQPLAAPRLSANDLSNYQEPLPGNPDTFMTFWRGNQLPSALYATQAHAWYVRYSEQQLRMTQRYGGNAGGPWLGAVQTASLMERMKAAWLQAASSSGRGSRRG